MGLGAGSWAKDPPYHPHPPGLAPTWPRVGLHLSADLYSDQFLPNPGGDRKLSALSLLSKWHLHFCGLAPPQTPTSFVDLQGLKKTRWGTPLPQLTLLGDQISGGKPTRWQCLYREDIQDCRTERPARRERSAPSLACWGQRPFGVRSTLGATLPRIWETRGESENRRQAGVRPHLLRSTAPWYPSPKLPH